MGDVPSVGYKRARSDGPDGRASLPQTIFWFRSIRKMIENNNPIWYDVDDRKRTWSGSMSRIHSKAKVEIEQKMLSDLLEYLEAHKAEEDWREKTLGHIQGLIDEIREKEAKKHEGVAWDFSAEKERDFLTSDAHLTIRPIRESDRPVYCAIRKYWDDANSDGRLTVLDDESLWKPVLQEHAFYCMAELDKQPIGYVAILDTRDPCWEVATEFLPEYCGKGYGTRSVKLFLKAIREITLIDSYCAKVEVDNIASQKCFEKLGAELTGLADGVLTESEQEAFEKANEDQINDHMRMLAKQLNVDPHRLLTHVLLYHIVLCDDE